MNRGSSINNVCQSLAAHIAPTASITTMGPFELSKLKRVNWVHKRINAPENLRGSQQSLGP